MTIIRLFVLTITVNKKVLRLLSQLLTNQCLLYNLSFSVPNVNSTYTNGAVLRERIRRRRERREERLLSVTGPLLTTRPSSTEIFFFKTQTNHRVAHGKRNFFSFSFFISVCLFPQRENVERNVKRNVTRGGTLL